MKRKIKNIHTYIPYKKNHKGIITDSKHKICFSEMLRFRTFFVKNIFELLIPKNTESNNNKDINSLIVCSQTVNKLLIKDYMLYGNFSPGDLFCYPQELFKYVRNVKIDDNKYLFKISKLIPNLKKLCYR